MAHIHRCISPPEGHAPALHCSSLPEIFLGRTPSKPPPGEGPFEPQSAKSPPDPGAFPETGSGRPKDARRPQSYTSKGIGPQGTGSFCVVRKSYVPALCPVVLCPYFCTSDALSAPPRRPSSRLPWQPRHARASSCFIVKRVIIVQLVLFTSMLCCCISTVVYFYHLLLQTLSCRRGRGRRASCRLLAPITEFGPRTETSSEGSSSIPADE